MDLHRNNWNIYKINDEKISNSNTTPIRLNMVPWNLKYVDFPEVFFKVRDIKREFNNLAKKKNNLKEIIDNAGEAFIFQKGSALIPTTIVFHKIPFDVIYLSKIKLAIELSSSFWLHRAMAEEKFHYPHMDWFPMSLNEGWIKAKWEHGFSSGMYSHGEANINKWSAVRCNNLL